MAPNELFVIADVVTCAINESDVVIEVVKPVVVTVCVVLFNVAVVIKLGADTVFLYIFNAKLSSAPNADCAYNFISINV